MPDVKLTIVDRQGASREVFVRPGDLLMRVLREQIDLTLGTCGGEVSCGTCLVRLSPRWVEAIAGPGEDEAEMLEALDAERDCRLSCQLELGRFVEGEQATIMPAV